METQNYPQPQSKPGFTSRNSLTIKILIILLLAALLLIPILIISGLISEREGTASSAVKEVHQKWSSKQLVVGPVITIPYLIEQTPTKQTRSYINVLPDELDITGVIKIEELNRGIYDIVVYSVPLKVKGKFKALDLKSINVKKEQLLLNEVSINIGISDLRGISEQVVLNWNNEKLACHSGVNENSVVTSGVSVYTEIEELLEQEGVINFSLDLKIKGSESLLFVPIGKTTEINLSSNCETPSFTGAFLPETRNVDNSGFTSQWKVLDLNRNFPQLITGKVSNSNYYYDDNYTTNRYRRYGSSLNVNTKFSEAVFGVNLLFSVDQYQKSMRSLKYAFLIIILTFVVCFFVEIIQKKNIHPFQYMLIGLALCLFYTLLISFSEHTGFSIAYLLASVMTTGLITAYMLGVLKIKKTALTIGGLLILLYAYIYFLIQLESYALLAGSIGLFVILAIVMFYSQKINWYSKD